MYSIVLESYAHDADRIALLGSFVIMRSTALFARSRIHTFMTPSGDGARYARCLPSGESLGETFVGLPNRTSRGMSSSDVVVARACVVDDDDDDERRRSGGVDERMGDVVLGIVIGGGAMMKDDVVSGGRNRMRTVVPRSRTEENDSLVSRCSISP